MQSKSFKAALFGDTGPAGETVASIYGAERLDYLRRRTELFPRPVTSANIEDLLPGLSEIEVIFATWGFFPLAEAQLDGLPALRAVFYAAGTVKYFADSLHGRGVTIVSSAAANAVPVAEFTLGQILLANKGYFRNLREYQLVSSPPAAFRGSGNYEATVSILGAGQVGRKLIELLRPFHLRVLVFDPFLSFKAADALGVEKVELNQAFERGDVVTNHLADVPDTVGLLKGEHFASMPKHATFLNTGRGKTVNHADLTRVFASRPDLTALLDVTEPEPLPLNHSLRRLPNVHISGHIGGSIGREFGRVADYALEEFEAWAAGRPLRFEVTPEMLEQTA
jgi:phosphoglycerate dehydrogenase-like enzyme